MMNENVVNKGMSDRPKTTSEVFEELRASLVELGTVLWDDHRLALVVFAVGVVIIEALWRVGML